jgi:hypothetical protein
MSAFYADPFNDLVPLLSQRDDLEEELDEPAALHLLSLQNEESRLDVALTGAESAFASAKAREVRLAKAFGRLSRPMVLRIEEEVYNTWSIRRPSYHGGDFVGPDCRLLMRLAEVVTGAITTLLLEVDVSDRATEVSDNDIQQFMGAIMRLLQYGDAICSIARKGERELTPADRQNCVQYVARFVRLWRLMGFGSPMKLHILEDHLVDNLGNGERLEDATEQQHQISSAFERRTRISCHETKQRVAARQEAIRNNPDVKKELNRVLVESSRPKRKEASQGKIDAEIKRRRAGRLSLLETDEIKVVQQIDNILLEELVAYTDSQEINV